MPSIHVRNCAYYYHEVGSGEETLVFAHGFLMDADMFRYQFDHFKDRFRIVAFDWRGQGRSEKTPSGYDMDSLYFDALALLEKLNCTSCHWIGLSMGGFIGMRIAARNPNRLKSLVLAGTGADAETLINKVKWGLLAILFRFFGVRPVQKGVLKTLFSPHSLNNPEFKPILLKYINKMKQYDRTTTYKIAWSIFNRKAVVDEITKITVPTLVMVGEDDIARPLHEAQRLVELIPHADLAIISQAGHSSALENPKSFNQELEQFLKKVSNAYS